MKTKIFGFCSGIRCWLCTQQAGIKENFTGVQTANDISDNSTFEIVLGFCKLDSPTSLQETNEWKLHLRNMKKTMWILGSRDKTKPYGQRVQR
ncbi:MAG: hypothetical protein M3270_11665 [Thermoproteota archaeon]|nr:hypothetical protein [Thermoproteota archaeon]